MLQKVEGHETLVRDTETGAIINTDSTQLSEYMKRRNDAMKRHNEIEQLKSDVSEMKQMMKKIMDVLNANDKK